MEQGISLDEACAKNVIGTQEDFERSCNPDGTVKQASETTTLSVKNSDTSLTIKNAYLYAGAAVAVAIIAVAIWIVLRKRAHK